MTARLDGGFFYDWVVMNNSENSNRQYKVPHIHRKRYYNHAEDRSRSFVLDSLLMFCKSYRKRKRWAQEALQWHSPELIQPEGISMTWIGHATFLINLDGFTILTDPIFGSPSRLFPRLLPPGIELEGLPHINTILISHNHRDHMDAHSLNNLKQRFTPVVLVPRGDKRWFEKRRFKHVYEYAWWQQHTFIHPKGNPITISFLPAHHWSQRGIFDRNKSLWGSWMIEYNGTTIYFAGDSAHAPHFSSIGNEFKNIDYALMPIGPCEPRHHMRHVHLSAEEAVFAFEELGARNFVPMHWGTFGFGVDTFLRPIELLQRAWGSRSLNHLRLPKAGQCLKII